MSKHIEDAIPTNWLDPLLSEALCVYYASTPHQTHDGIAGIAPTVCDPTRPNCVNASLALATLERLTGEQK